MTAHRSKAEVSALCRLAGDRNRRMHEIMPVSGPWPTAGIIAIHALERAITNRYARKGSNEAKYNALRDAIALADAEIDKYHQSVSEEKS